MFPEVPSMTVPPGLMRPSLLGSFKHADADAILHASAGIEVLEFREQDGFQTLTDPVKPDHRRVADDFKNVFVPHGLVTCGGLSGFHFASFYLACLFPRSDRDFLAVVFQSARELRLDASEQPFRRDHVRGWAEAEDP